MANFFTIDGGKSKRNSDDQESCSILRIFVKYLEEPIVVEGSDALIIHGILEDAIKAKKEVVSISQYYGFEVTHTIRITEIYFVQFLADQRDLGEGWRVEPGVYHNFTK